MPATRKKRGRPPDTALQQRRRETILDAAALVFARHGYPKADVQLIADALCLSKGTVYRYFGSKERLFFAAVDRGLTRLRDHVNAAAARAADPLARVENAIRAYLEFFRDHPELVELLIQERAEFKDRRTSTYFAHREANLGPWRDLYRELAAAGRLRDVPVERLLDVAGELVYGTMFTAYFSDRPKPLGEQVRDLLDVYFFGILSDGERARRRQQGTKP